MRVKDLASLLAAMIFLAGFINEAISLSISTFSFRGAGVMIDLTFPETAQPTETITHNLTITAYAPLRIENFTIVIKALVDSSWQQLSKEQIFMHDILQDEYLTRQMMFTLPQNAQERLYCFMYILTGKTAEDPCSYIFYTTQVDTLGYEELLNQYNELLAEYSNLLSSYETLLESYDNLSIQHDTLNSTYNSLLDQHNELQTFYSTLNSTYYDQKASYDSLQSDYNALETSYNQLVQTYTAMQTATNDLWHRIDALNNGLTLARNVMYTFGAAIVVLVALTVYLIYLKKKKPEPYIVVRKEEVKLKKDK